MTHHHDATRGIMTIHHDESSHGTERIPFKVVTALLAMGGMNTRHASIHGAHSIFQAETVNMAIAENNVSPQTNSLVHIPSWAARVLVFKHV